MSDHSSPSSSWVTIAAVIGGFAIFAVILIVAYLPKTPPPLPDGVKTPEQRHAILIEHRAKEAKAATSYAWVDQGKGVVQLPLDRAVELTIQELNAGRK
jgi:hypothetical protein